MSANSELANLTLLVDLGQGVDADELDRATRQLRYEIQDLDVDSIELVKSVDPVTGAKSVEAVTVGSLAVAVLPTLVPKLVEFLQSWALRGESRKIKIKTQVGDRSVEIEYSPKTTSPAELQSLVEMLANALDKKSKKSH